MFDRLDRLPPDPILGVGAAFAADPNPNKVNLGVGVYQDEHGKTPLFSAVVEAEQRVIAAQKTKSYVAQAGDPAFRSAMTAVVLGVERASQLDGRLATIATVGGSGALRVAAELVATANPTATLWVPTPTWANHFPLLGGANIKLQPYPYYDSETHQVDVDAMMATLSQVGPGDVVIMQACCHNPTGADLDLQQMAALVDLLNNNDSSLLIDLAYQGFGVSLASDVAGVGYAIDHLRRVMVAVSCSKTFGVYRDRVGLLAISSPTMTEAQSVHSQALAITRKMYSMPAYHGSAVVAEVLGDGELRALWIQELDCARRRLVELRIQFADALNQAQGVRDFGFLTRQRGMFSVLGLSQTDVAWLADAHSVFLVGSSRANLAGLRVETVHRVATAIAEAVTR